MILKGKKKKTTLPSSIIPAILIAILLVLWGLKTNFFKKTTKNIISDGTTLSVYCGAEKVAGENFINKGVEFLGGKTQSDKKVRTGKYSSKLDKEFKYGITYQLKNPIQGKSYKVEVWSYSHDEAKRFLAVLGERPDSENFYKQVNKSVESDGDWWIKYELFFTLPVQNPVKSVNIYVFKDDGDKVVYFDDFKIEEIDTIIGIERIDFEPKELKLQVDKEGLERLEKIKKRAFSTGLLVQSAGDEVEARILENGNFIDSKIRYKGDWLDHIMSGLPSFRIKLKAQNSWNGLQTFSVQHPKTRGYLREWVFHEFLKQSDVLTPRYDFIYFKFNDKKPVVRALEEHFTKNLVEHQLRREGPIIKFTEDRFWEGIRRSIKMRRKIADSDNKERAFWTSEIKPFKEKKTSNTPVLQKEFSIAQNLLFQYKFGLKKPADVFDIDKLAKFLVITDICRAYHTLTWHNQRFYYNPVTSLLEPIGFDGHGSQKPYPITFPIYAEKVYSQKPYSTEPVQRLFYDAEFLKKYIGYLNEYVQTDFIKNFISQIEEPVHLREKLLQKVKKDYHFNTGELIERANKIRENILPFSNSLQIFRKSVDKDSFVLQFYNAHILPFEIVNIGEKNSERQTSTGKGTLIFPQDPQEVPDYVEVKVPSQATHVFYKLPGIDSIFIKAIPQWSSPQNWSPRSELLDLVAKGKNRIYEEENGVVIFPQKEYDIETPIIIPKGKKVIIEQGVVFKFSNGGFFLSFSPVAIMGDSEEPVFIETKDNNSGSFTVLQAKEKSFFRHVIFKGQNTLDYKGWNLTGGVTLYESDCDFIDCKFIGNKCEDALNIVRSDFVIEKCSFTNIAGDAFDADFCKGKITDVRFWNVNNDALDFSTSVIEVTECDMDNIGDKGMSVGEQATVTANHISVKNANIAFASKDLSIFKLNNITITNCKKGIVAFQKKPEYGPATIILRKHEINTTEHPFMIEEGSVLEKK